MTVSRSASVAGASDQAFSRNGQSVIHSQEQWLGNPQSAIRNPPTRTSTGVSSFRQSLNVAWTNSVSVY
jgi:hypothetical protein